MALVFPWELSGIFVLSEDCHLSSGFIVASKTTEVSRTLASDAGEGCRCTVVRVMNSLSPPLPEMTTLFSVLKAMFYEPQLSVP